MAFGNAKIFVYADHQREIVGLGTIDFCSDHANLSGNLPHTHIPLLAVHPGKEGLGHGKAILRHLIGEAVLICAEQSEPCHDILYLEVYESSLRAIALYEKCGFKKVVENPIHDPEEGKSFFIMGLRVKAVA